VNALAEAHADSAAEQYGELIKGWWAQ